MNGNRDQQARVLGRDPGRSFIVQAPAGSGKTELLTQRMLGLLARVENPEEVVAITFTRKAAAEMSHRLVRRLQQATGDIDLDALAPHEKTSLELARAVLKNDAAREWNLLQQPSRLRIRTIDSLCSDLARQLPILSGLGGGLQITEEAKELYREAAVRTMSAIEDENDPLQADVIRILDRYDNQYDRLVELLVQMLGDRDQWMAPLFGQGELAREALEEALRYLVERQLEQALELMPPGLLNTLPPFFEYALGHEPADQEQLAALLEACGGAGGGLALSADADCLPHWRTLINRFLTVDGKKWRATPDVGAGFPAPYKARGEEKTTREFWKHGFTELLDNLRDDDILREQFNTIRKLPRPAYGDEAWASLEALIRILVRAAAHWKVVLAESGTADFTEVSQRAIQALGHEESPSQLALRLDYRIQHLLVDEFQDTSHSQVRLLELLTAGWCEGDGRTLFLVGDPMQSIYRFRKAEVSLFIEAFSGHLFDHIRLEPLRLEVNFRSTKPIVDWVNNVFPAVMPNHNDPVNGAVSYSPSISRPDASDAGRVAVKIEAVRDDLDEAQQVVEIIRNRPPGETVAILVRARSHAAATRELLDRLKPEDQRFRYSAIDLNPLAETIVIRDLVSLTLALIQPADRLHWLSVLRAPFTGLELADLDALADPGQSLLIPVALEAALRDPEAFRISADGRARLQRIGPVLLEASAMRGRESVRSRVETAWVQLGGPACVENASELEDAETYFELLETLETSAVPIDQDTLDRRLEKLYAKPDAQADGTLQVMTIYAAKGLQFDTVIVPGLNRDTGSDPPRLLHWFEIAEKNCIVMSPMRNVEEKALQKSEGDLIQFISTVEKRRQALETGRLLYVAATRAVHSLYLFGAVKPTSKGLVKPSGASLLGQLWPAISAQHEALIIDTAEDSGDKTEQEEGAAEILPQRYRRLHAEWKPPEPPPAVQRSRAEYPEPPEAIEFRWAGEAARLSGDLVHRLLQSVAEQGLDTWLARGGLDASEAWCLAQLAREGVRGEAALPVIRRTRKAVETCLSSETGRWILKDHEAARCEWAITALLEGQPVNLVLDRTFVDEETRWIIDYKTSSHSGGDLEGFLASEEERYREQLARYREAVALKETRPIRTALYFPLLDRLLEVD
jgi:ATP-dependent exoDNAse (exonuclease V) beta subunit